MFAMPSFGHNMIMSLLMANRGRRVGMFAVALACAAVPLGVVEADAASHSVASTGIAARGHWPSWWYQAPGLDGHPERWNPCETITWSFPRATRTDLRLMRRAVKKVSTATGIRFAYRKSKGAVDIHYVSFGPYTGPSGSSDTTRRGEQVNHFVRGGISLPKDYRTKRYSNRKKLQSFLLEWGGVMGLADVPSRRQVMGMYQPNNPLAIHFLNRISGRFTSYQAGDRAGLRAVGRSSGCLEPPTIPAHLTAYSQGPDPEEDGYLMQWMSQFAADQSEADTAYSGYEVELANNGHSLSLFIFEPCAPGVVHIWLHGDYGSRERDVPYNCVER